MKIAFVWDWEPDYYQALTWQDGLSAALRELRNRGHEITVLTCGKTDNIIHNPYHDIQVSSDVFRDISQQAPDVILHFADFTRPNAFPLAELHIPMAICFTGGSPVTDRTPLFAHIFVESQVYKDKLEATGYDNVSIAFGTNTELFQPVPNQPKLYDTIMPGTFALWKRHRIYAPAVSGLRALAVGYMYQEHEQECWQDCLKNGVQILPHVSAETLRYLYAASKICVVTSESAGGSQRTVLEAMAMNIPLVVTDSDKFDYVHGYAFETEPTIESIRGTVRALLDGEHETNSRDYVTEQWSEYSYANALEQGLNKIANA